MVHNYILPIYNLLYDEKFTVSTFSNRLKMQKGIYMLQELGVSVGNYGFSWYKHGPYSQSLQDEMLHAGNNDIERINLSDYSEKCIKKLHKLIHTETEYEEKDWIECVASMHYIKNYLLSKNATDEQIINALTKKKPHLNKIDTNKLALKCLKEVFN